MSVEDEKRESAPGQDTGGRMFPILWPTTTEDIAECEQLGCPREIPWALIARHEEQLINCYGAGLEAMAARGGLSPQEAAAVFGPIIGRGYKAVLEYAVCVLKIEIAGYYFDKEAIDQQSAQPTKPAPDATERMFPIRWPTTADGIAEYERLGCPREIPWSLIARHEKHLLSKYGYGAEGISRKGGLSPQEAALVIRPLPVDGLPIARAIQILDDATSLHYLSKAATNQQSIQATKTVPDATERMFPICTSHLPPGAEAEYGRLGCPRSIPWGLMVEYEERANRNHQGSLDAIAADGGLSPREMASIFVGRTVAAANREQVVGILSDALARYARNKQNVETKAGPVPDVGAERMFPICFSHMPPDAVAKYEQLGCPRSIPWAVLAQHEKRVIENHEACLEELANNGGMTPREIVAVLTNMPTGGSSTAQVVESLLCYVRRRRVKTKVESAPVVDEDSDDKDDEEAGDEGEPEEGFLWSSEDEDAQVTVDAQREAIFVYVDGQLGKMTHVEGLQFATRLVRYCESELARRIECLRAENQRLKERLKKLEEQKPEERR